MIYTLLLIAGFVLTFFVYPLSMYLNILIGAGLLTLSYFTLLPSTTPSLSSQPAISMFETNPTLIPSGLDSVPIVADKSIDFSVFAFMVSLNGNASRSSVRNNAPIVSFVDADNANRICVAYNAEENQLRFVANAGTNKEWWTPILDMPLRKPKFITVRKDVTYSLDHLAARVYVDGKFVKAFTFPYKGSIGKTLLTIGNQDLSLIDAEIMGVKAWDTSIPSDEDIQILSKQTMNTDFPSYHGEKGDCTK